jgi:hypothetical protein
MNDHALRPDERLHGLLDQVFARLHEHLNGDIIGDAPFLDEVAIKGEFGVRRGRETDFDFLEAAAHQRLEKLQLLRNVHGHGEGLIAVAQIDRAPDGRAADDLARPFSVRQGDCREGSVFHRGTGKHGFEMRMKRAWTFYQAGRCLRLTKQRQPKLREKGSASRAHGRAPAKNAEQRKSAGQKWPHGGESSEAAGNCKAARRCVSIAPSDMTI